jgi:hypothetical protein
VSETGLDARSAELDERAERWDKPAYAAAAQAARRLARRLREDDVPHAVGQADALDPGQLRRVLGDRRPGLVITDVPYGERTAWQGPHGATGVPGLLRALATVLPEDAVIAIAVRGRRISLGDGPRPRTTFKIGTRTVALYRGLGLREPRP